MSNKVVRTILANGTKTAQFHYYFESDGVEGELKNYILWDTQQSYDTPQTNFDILPADPYVLLRLSQAWWSFSWFDGALTYNDTNPTPFWILARDNSNYMDFRYFDGLADRVQSGIAQQDWPFSQVMFSTNGFAPAGSVGTLVLEFRKTVVPANQTSAVIPS